MKILDPACGSKMFWFDKNESHTTYTDIRKEILTMKDRKYTRKIIIDPDKVANFTDLPFDEEEFNLIVFDPPHLNKVGANSWLAKKYGQLDRNSWPTDIEKGFKDVFTHIPYKPILGDKRGHTRWFVFIKVTD